MRVARANSSSGRKRSTFQLERLGIFGTRAGFSLLLLIVAGVLTTSWLSAGIVIVVVLGILIAMFLRHRNDAFTALRLDLDTRALAPSTSVRRRRRIQRYRNQFARRALNRLFRFD